MHQNPFVPGYEVLSKSSISYVNSNNAPAYLLANDFPAYATMFYSPTEHEVFSQIKYGNFVQDYSNLREIQKSLNGMLHDFYVPASFIVQDGAGKQNKFHHFFRNNNSTADENANIESFREIIKAQEQVKKRTMEIKFEEIFLMRRMRKITIFEEG